MITKYNEYIFLTETLQKGESIVKNKLADYEKLKSFFKSSNSMGYVGKFTEFLFSGVPYNELIRLYNEIIFFKSKNIKINIDSYDKYETALDDLDKKKIAYKFKSIYNRFPKKQKDLFNLDDIENEDLLTISKLYDVDDITPFIGKISRYESSFDLIKAVELFLKGKLQPFDREFVKSMIDDELELVFENDNILIVKTKTWDAIKKVGSDTSWCIVSSQYTFDNYTKNKNRNQYVVFDYTKDSFEIDFKIGFTVDIDNNITNAHDILDTSSKQEVKELLDLNKVLISDINIIPKQNITINAKSSLAQIKTAISHITNVDDFREILTILCSRQAKLNIIKRDVLLLIHSLIRRLSIKLGVDILTENDLNSYRECFVSKKQFENIKIDLSNEFLLLTNKPPSNFFNRDYDKLVKYYKNWNFDLGEYSYSNFFIRCKDKRYAEILLFYLKKSDINKMRVDYKLLFEYCKMIVGEPIDMIYINKLIDTVDNKIFYYEIFSIKYHFDEKKYHRCTEENIIPEKIDIKDPDNNLISKLKVLTNCDVTLNYTKEIFLNIVNENYKMVNRTTKVITKRSNSLDEFVGQMISAINDDFSSKSREIVFKDDVKFPIQFKVELKSARYRISKMVTVLIN